MNTAFIFPSFATLLRYQLGRKHKGWAKKNEIITLKGRYHKRGGCTDGFYYSLHNLLLVTPNNCERQSNYLQPEAENQCSSFHGKLQCSSVAEQIHCHSWEGTLHPAGDARLSLSQLSQIESFVPSLLFLETKPLVRQQQDTGPPRRVKRNVWPLCTSQ